MALSGRLAALIQKITSTYWNNLSRVFGVEVPQLAITGDAGTVASRGEDPLQWDGLVFAGGLGGCPKHKRGIEVRRRKKHDLRRWYPFIRSWHMLVPCDSCGGYKKKFHLCETCYDQTRYETQRVREKLKQAGLDLSHESVLQYTDDHGRFHSDTGSKRVISIDRKRPSGWFSPDTWGK